MRSGRGPPDDDGPDDTDPADATVADAIPDEGAAALHVPRGELLRSRVVADPATMLRTALAERLTGYATVAPGETLLLDGEARGVVTFSDGVPVLAYAPATDDGGPDALAALAEPGPVRIELYRLPPAALTEPHDTPALRVAPGAPAAELAGDPGLADRTREVAPEERLDDADEGGSAVAAFLDEEERLASIREQARAEAAERAAEWGLDDALVADPSPESAVTDPVTDSESDTPDRK